MATVVISPYKATKMLDRGGNFWVYLQYALGLQAIGCDVRWLERLDRPGEPSWPGIEASPDEQAAMLADTLGRFGISSTPILYTTENEHEARFEPTYVGLDEREAEAVLQRADLLLNFHQEIHRDLLARFERTALVDIDPGLLQYWMSSGQLDIADHHHYFTTGETVGTRAARFPDCGRAWTHIRPPVFLGQWPFTSAPVPAPFTTVSSWYSSEYILEGDGYWDNNKRVSWLEFAELPRLTDQPLELATHFGSRDQFERLLMEGRGWRVRHAGDVADTLESYRSYIQSSRAEFSCAKPSCMRFQNAWISDRTVCYLASGRPVVVQDTGPSSIPGGSGLHRFSTIDEAAAAIEAVNAAYDRNCRAARELAEAHFDATGIARSIIETALGTPGGPRGRRQPDPRTT